MRSIILVGWRGNSGRSSYWDEENRELGGVGKVNLIRDEVVLVHDIVWDQSLWKLEMQNKFFNARRPINPPMIDCLAHSALK